jgi:hypothetical protein
VHAGGWLELGWDAWNFGFHLTDQVPLLWRLASTCRTCRGHGLETKTTTCVLPIMHRRAPCKLHFWLQAWRAALLFVAAGFFCRAITSAGHDIENLITALGERGLGDLSYCLDPVCFGRSEAAAILSLGSLFGWLKSWRRMQGCSQVLNGSHDVGSMPCCVVSWYCVSQVGCSNRRSRSRKGSPAALSSAGS